MRAFLDAMAASNGGSTRIDFIESKEHGLMEASRIVAREGNELLGEGTYHDKSAKTRSVTCACPVMPRTLRKRSASVALMCWVYITLAVN
jgi:hypothetical protein